MTSVVRLLATLALGALLAPSIASATDAGDIVVVSLKGEVHFTMQGRARTIRAGGVLEPPVTLRTGRDGAVELRQGATTLSVGPETLLEFPALEKPGAPIDRIVQPVGNVFYDIGKRPGRKLRIETPYLVGVVKGTQFNVAARDGATTISLFEGLLEVRDVDGSGVVDLKAGEIASRGHDAPDINVLKMSAGKDAPRIAPPALPRPSSGNESGKAASPTSPRVAPRARDRGPVLVESTATPERASPAVVGAQPVNAPAAETIGVRADPVPALDAAGVAAVNSPVVETNVSVVAETPAAGANTPVELPATNVGVGVDVGVSVPVAETAPVIAAPSTPEVAVEVAVGVDSSDTGASVTVGASAGQVEVQVGSDTAVEAVAGTVNRGLEIITVDEDLDAALGLDTGNGNGNGNANGFGTDNGNGNGSGNDNGNANGNGNSNGNGNGTASEVVELLDSLVRRPGKK